VRLGDEPVSVIRCVDVFTDFKSFFYVKKAPTSDAPEERAIGEMAVCVVVELLL